MKVLLAAFVSGCVLSSLAWAEPIPSLEQAREWIEAHPQVEIRNSDKFTDYRRDGKVVFRKIARMVRVGSKTSEASSDGAPMHLLEFVADGKVILVVQFNESGILSWNLTSGSGAHFSSGPAALDGSRRFIYLAVPRWDYFEYLEISGTEVKLVPETAESYAAQKRGFASMVETGYVNKLQGASGPK